MSILLIGGAGYIGSHTCVALVQAGYTPVVVDNFSNSHPAVLQRLQQITGVAIACEQGDVADAAFMTDVLRRHTVQAVIHFAGYNSNSNLTPQQFCRVHLTHQIPPNPPFSKWGTRQALKGEGSPL